MLAIFGITTLIVVLVTVIHFCRLKKRHTINFNAWMLFNTTLFTLSFFASQLVLMAMQF